jgi:hypothetical protein
MIKFINQITNDQEDKLTTTAKENKIIRLKTILGINFNLGCISKIHDGVARGFFFTILILFLIISCFISCANSIDWRCYQLSAADQLNSLYNYTKLSN